jgi:hypothetical protein
MGLTLDIVVVVKWGLACSCSLVTRVTLVEKQSHEIQHDTFSGMNENRSEGLQKRK